MFPQCPAHLDPVHFRHHQIQDNHRGHFMLRNRQPLRPVRRFQHVKARRPEIRPEQHPDVRFVVHHQHAVTHSLHRYLLRSFTRQSP